jgi:Putative DNA-binding domain
MSEPRHTLDELQRWMQGVITHPEGAAAGIASPGASDQIAVAPGEIERVVARSQALSAVERLDIYNRAYFGRLLECLREEYSVLAFALGEELFDAFAVGYLQTHPSTNYTLGKLGESFPDYLAASRPARDGGEPADWPEFMVDLARLERVVNEVFDGPGAEGRLLLTAERLQEIPAERWPNARFTCAPSLRLVELKFPVSEFFGAAHRKETAPVPPARESFVAVNRQEYRVRRYELTAPQHALLAALIACAPVGTAIERAAALSPAGDDQLAADLSGWFRAWTTAGFFCDVVG